MSLFDAITDNDLEECERLIKSGVDVNQYSQDFYGYKPLDLALIYDRRNIISLLQQNGGELKYFISKISEDAYDSNYSDIKFILKKIKIDLNDQEVFSKRCPLASAIYNRSIKILKLFLEHGADPSLKKCGESMPHNDNYKGKKLTPIKYAMSLSDRDKYILMMMKFLDERNTKTRIIILVAREFDAGSLLHRDYLPLDMFRLIFASMMKN